VEPVVLEMADSAIFELPKLEVSMLYPFLRQGQFYWIAPNSVSNLRYLSRFRLIDVAVAKSPYCGIENRSSSRHDGRVLALIIIRRSWH